MSVRQDVLIRDGFRCFRCGRPLTGNTPWDCHHRLFTGSGGPDDCPNRISLCGFGNNLLGPDGETWCHGWVHNHKKLSMPEGWAISRHATESPEAIPVRHHTSGLVLLLPDYSVTDLQGHAVILAS